MVTNQLLVNPNGGTATERNAMLALSALGLLLVLHQLNILWLLYVLMKYVLLGITALVLVVDCFCFRPKPTHACRN
jgi:hypothetical protein